MISRTSRSGLTLIELLTVLAVVALLTAIAIPALRHARESGRGVRCQANLRSIGVGLTAYLESSRGRLPYTITPPAAGSPEPFATLAPLIGVDLPTVASGGIRRVEPYACPSDVTEWRRTGFSYDYRPVAEFIALGGSPRAVDAVTRFYAGPPERDVFACYSRHYSGPGIQGTNVLYFGGTARRGR